VPGDFVLHHEHPVVSLPSGSSCRTDGTPGRGFVDEHVADGMFELVGGLRNHGIL